VSDEARRGRQVTSREPADADAYYSRAIAADPSHGPSYGFKALLLVRQATALLYSILFYSTAPGASSNGLGVWR